MSREWVSKKDHRWVMCCNECGHTTEPRASQNDLPLEEFVRRGWFIAKIYGDWCPSCVVASGGIGALIASGRTPSEAMKAASS